MIVTVTTELGGQQLSLCFLAAEPKHYTDPNVPEEGTAKENSHEGRGFICLTHRYSWGLAQCRAQRVTGEWQLLAPAILNLNNNSVPYSVLMGLSVISYDNSTCLKWLL